MHCLYSYVVVSSMFSASRIVCWRFVGVQSGRIDVVCLPGEVKMADIASDARSGLIFHDTLQCRSASQRRPSTTYDGRVLSLASKSERTLQTRDSVYLFTRKRACKHKAYQLMLSCSIDVTQYRLLNKLCR